MDPMRMGLGWDWLWNHVRSYFHCTNWLGTLSFQHPLSKSVNEAKPFSLRRPWDVDTAGFPQRPATECPATWPDRLSLPHLGGTIPGLGFAKHSSKWWWVNGDEPHGRIRKESPLTNPSKYLCVYSPVIKPLPSPKQRLENAISAIG